MLSDHVDQHHIASEETVAEQHAHCMSTFLQIAGMNKMINAVVNCTAAVNLNYGKLKVVISHLFVKIT
jgi:hypothetical protein